MGSPLRHAPGALATGLALATLLLGVGCGDRGVPCPTLCARAKACRGEVSAALLARLPRRSPALQHVRRELPKRLLDRLLGSCPERCTALRRNKRWREALRRCAPQQGCADFARCLAPALEP